MKSSFAYCLTCQSCPSISVVAWVTTSDHRSENFIGGFGVTVILTQLQEYVDEECLSVAETPASDFHPSTDGAFLFCSHSLHLMDLAFGLDHASAS